MGQLDIDETVKDLLALRCGDIVRQVDALIDAYLVGADPGRFWQKRAELAHEFLNAAPFSELSYCIWRRVAGEDDNGELAFQSDSMEFLPPVEFQMS